jgi:hypothetical protein
MKFVKTFESFRVKKNREDIIKEAVLQVNDIYKVKTMIDIPQSLINAYVKKVKDTTGKNLRQFFGDVDIAEEIVKYINTSNLDIENLPGGALLGGQSQTQNQSQVQSQGQAQTQGQAQIEFDETPVQGQSQGQVQGQAQVQDVQGDELDLSDEFDEPQAQVQVQTQGQSQGEVQGQVQTQGQAQVQSQSQAQFEDEEDEDEELPL